MTSRCSPSSCPPSSSSRPPATDALPPQSVSLPKTPYAFSMFSASLANNSTKAAWCGAGLMPLFVQCVLSCTVAPFSANHPRHAPARSASPSGSSFMPVASSSATGRGGGFPRPCCRADRPAPAILSRAMIDQRPRGGQPPLAAFALEQRQQLVDRFRAGPRPPARRQPPPRPDRFCLLLLDGAVRRAQGVRRTQRLASRVVELS